MENLLRIALFPNSYKTQENRQPDYRSNKNDRIVINDKYYEVAIWKKKSMNGKEYLSLSLSETSAPQVEDMPPADDRQF